MHHKSLVVLIQCRNCKLLLINDPCPLVCGYYLSNIISSPDKLSFCKPYICIAKIEEKHPQNHFYLSVGYQTSLLEESNFSQLVIERKTCYNHAKDFQIRSVNFLSSNISPLDAEAEFLSIGGIYYIDFAV